jgi:hypothetical protein
MLLAKSIEDLIIQRVNEVLSTKEYSDVEYIETDSLGEVIEKLIILHIRTWMLEDAIQEAKSNDEIADLKKKIDICFKVKRPKFVEAINKITDNSIITGKSISEDSVKLYKGIK